MRYLFTFFLGYFLMSCSNKNLTLIIQNHTNEPIVNMQVIIQGKQFKVQDIPLKDSKKIEIPLNTIDLSTHNFRIETNIIYNDGYANNGFFYTDLSGRPRNEYLIKIFKDKTLIQ